MSKNIIIIGLFLSIFTIFKTHILVQKWNYTTVSNQSYFILEAATIK